MESNKGFFRGSIMFRDFEFFWGGIFQIVWDKPRWKRFSEGKQEVLFRKSRSLFSNIFFQR